MKRLSFVINKSVCEKGISRFILELRESNEAALRLYLKFGFRVVGERRGYYLTPSGREKALLMERELIAIGGLGD
jgi:ribosomal-protein-alanine N-acetyltransferase